MLPVNISLDAKSFDNGMISHVISDMNVFLIGTTAGQMEAIQSLHANTKHAIVAPIFVSTVAKADGKSWEYDIVDNSPIQLPKFFIVKSLRSAKQRNLKVRENDWFSL